MRGPLRPSWTEELESWSRLLHYYAKNSIHLSVATQRKMMGAAPKTARTRHVELERVDAGGVPAKWFCAPELEQERVLFYLHGGGYSVGSIASHREIIARLCLASKMRGLSIDYRLAPEHPFPAQLVDALAAYRWLVKQVRPERVVIAGDSAGGGLTLSTLLSLRDAREPLPAAAILFSPWVDLEMSGESMNANHRFDYVSRKTLRAYVKRFVLDHDVRNPLAAPIHADLRGLPPILVQAGAAETLLDDARALARRAQEHGVDVKLEVDDDMIHVWHAFAPFLPQAQEAIERAGRFARSHVATQERPSVAT